VASIDLQKIAVPAVFVLTVIGFVIIGGGNLELGPIEAKIGNSAVEPLGPYGQTLGAWEPSVWVGTVLPSRLWNLASGMWDAAIVRWPSVIAAILCGFALVRSCKLTTNARTAILASFAWFGAIAVIDRSADAGLEMIAGLGTILALNRIVTKGSDWLAGLFAGWAFLAGGWPPIAMIGLAVLVLGRSGSSLSYKLILPIVATIGGWSTWALMTSKAELWASALSLPLTQSSAWTMALSVAGLALPWSPIAALGLFQSIRDRWSIGGRLYLVGWGQITLASLIAGTIIPGLASAATLPALAGLAVVAAGSLDAILAGPISSKAKAWLNVTSLLVVVGWTTIALLYGGQLALAVGYYRSIAITLIAIAIGTTTIAVSSAWLGDRRGTVAALVLVAISFKLAHFGYHVPEWNYRHSQAPWGRAIGQWVPYQYPIQVLHAWPSDLVFSIGRPVRHVVDPRLIPGLPGPNPKFVLLLQSEFDHWLDKWPKIEKVAKFEDEFGDTRVLARTEGPFSWRKAATAAAKPED
jgi:hypothetical protein